MGPARTRIVVLATLLLLCVGTTAGASVPVPRAGPVLDPGATRVWAPCVGEPGTMSVTVEPPGPDGSSQVTVKGRRMVEGSRWKIQVQFGDQRFRRTAEDGSWTVTTQVTFEAGDEVAYVEAARIGSNRHGGIHGCLVVTERAHPAAGAAMCHRGLDVMITRRLDDGTVVVRYFDVGATPGQLWHVVLRAADTLRAEEVAFDARAGRRGILRTRAEFDGGFVHPHLKAVATNEAGRTCRLRLNPADIDSATMAPRQLVPGRLGLH